MTDSMELKDQNEEIEVVIEVEESNPIEPEVSIQEHIENFVTVQNELTQIKTYINAIIDSIAKNQSFFTRAALIWGKMPLWQKIGAGILFIAPSLIVGIVLQLVIPYVISALCLALFVASDYVLRNHHTNDQQVTEKLKETMGGLADILEHSVKSLHFIREQISAEIEYFHNENDRLTLKISELSQQILNLSKLIEAMQETQKNLQAQSTDLESLTQRYQESLHIYENLLTMNQFDLDQIKKEMDQNQSDLNLKITELNNVNSEMNTELSKLQQIITLNKTVINTFITQIKNMDIDDEHHADLFKSRLDSFIEEKDASFKIIAQRIYGAERELAQVKEELNQSTRQKKLLLDREEKAIDLLAKGTTALRDQTIADTTSTPKNTEALQKFGLLAVASENTRTENQNMELTQELSLSSFNSL